MEDIYGKHCYEGYKASCEGKTWDGKEMMNWENMPNDKKIHWIIGANNVVDKFVNKNHEDMAIDELITFLKKRNIFVSFCYATKHKILFDICYTLGNVNYFITVGLKIGESPFWKGKEKFDELVDKYNADVTIRTEVSEVGENK